MSEIGQNEKNIIVHNKIIFQKWYYRYGIISGQNFSNCCPIWGGGGGLLHNKAGQNQSPKLLWSVLITGTHPINLN